MGYKEKFQAAEHDVLNRIVATKILRDMDDLRAKVGKGDGTSPVSKRWVWELIQNAKDVHNNRVSIQVDFISGGSGSVVVFRHNGQPFTANNIRYLIEQTSDKERKKDDSGRRTQTGKFGTGFLTTHLLSEIVEIEAVAKEPDLEYRKFRLVLNRSGLEIEDIIKSVEVSKLSVQNLDELPTYTNYVEGVFNTTFTYPLNDKVAINVANAGISDLAACLPFTLVFVREISDVAILSQNLSFHNPNDALPSTGPLSIVPITVHSGAKKKTIAKVAKWSEGFTSIAIPIEEQDGQIAILPLSDKTARLYCDFPLVGTESFPFPVIINNPNFNPTDPRDGVFLTTQERVNTKVDENKAVVIEAINLYFELLEYAANNKWKNLHLLAQISEYSNAPEWIDVNWYRNTVVVPIRNRLLYAQIVNTASNEVASILDANGQKFMWFPATSKKETRLSIWKLANDWFPHCIPSQADIELWYKLAWQECGFLTLDTMGFFIENTHTTIELTKLLRAGIDTENWLNDFYALLFLEDNEHSTTIKNRSIVPDQNGDFKRLALLSKDKGDIGDELKDILTLLGNDIRSQLCDPNLNVPFEDNDVIDLAYVVKEITSEVTEKSNDRVIAKDYRDAFRKLLLWFRSHPEQAQSLFPTINNRKHLLYDDDEILDNITKAEELSELMTEFNVTSIEALRGLMSKGKINSPLLPITESILTSLGITSVDEWYKAMENKNLSEMFSHESVPTQEMFLFVQGIIAKAKANIIQHLRTLSDIYDLQYLDEDTAPTLLAGVLKYGREITIVTRPAYNHEVIIYYGSERDILDTEPSELWVDDGKVRQITLGHILKTSGIVKFPI